MKYKVAKSQGAYIDRLRTVYPFRICRESEPGNEGVLYAAKPLLNGQQVPIYRFPDGDCYEDPYRDGIRIVEW